MKKNKYSINDMRAIAESRGGSCLSDKVEGNNIKLWFQCACGNQWPAPPSTIVKGHWCPLCGIRKRAEAHKQKGQPNAQERRLLEMQQIAKERGGQCLSTHSPHHRFKLRFRCGVCNKEWETRPDQIKAGKWCPKCGLKRMHDGNKKHTIASIKAYAVKRGGECLSSDYTDNDVPLLWECSKGHKWHSPLRNVLNMGSWCPKCAGNRKITIEELKTLAEKRGGKCLKLEYRDERPFATWVCNLGHEWKSLASGVINNGHWCPKCAESYGEKLCRMIVESAFDKAFPKSHPEWLRNRNGYKMELDGYNRTMRLAFEYNGRHHYEPGLFNRNDFPKRLRLDAEKVELCKERGIELVQVNEFRKITHINKCIDAVREAFDKAGMKLPALKREIDLTSIYIQSKNLLNELRGLVESKGGKVISKKYIGSEAKYEFMCEKGHTWEATLYSIRYGHWCRICAYKMGTIEEMREIAKKRGGQCLSERYYDNKTRLTWACKNGHKWEATPKEIKKGSWCPFCRKEGAKGSKKHTLKSKSKWLFNSEQTTALRKLILSDHSFSSPKVIQKKKHKIITKENVKHGNSNDPGDEKTARQSGRRDFSDGTE